MIELRSRVIILGYGLICGYLWVSYSGELGRSMKVRLLVSSAALVVCLVGVVVVAVSFFLDFYYSLVILL